MPTATKTNIVNLVEGKELLLLFREYVDQCIEDFTFSNKCYPKSFAEWYEYEYKPNIDDHTSVVTFDLKWEGAAGGHLTGTNGPESFQVRIPAEIVTDTGGIIDIEDLRRFAKLFADKMNRRLPTVLYRGERVYFWTWN